MVYLCTYSDKELKYNRGWSLEHQLPTLPTMGWIF